jgi:predicted NUDIX family phosphoesterase
MKDYGKEEVLVVEANFLNSILTDCFGYDDYLNKTKATIDTVNVDLFEETFNMAIASGGKWMLRNDAEFDPSHKQIIPYCLISYRGTILHYSRAKTAAEARLSGQRSIGVGGHINPSDAPELDQTNIRQVLLRELKEEIGLNEDSIADMSIIGWVNDAINEVGKVHFGIVVMIELKTPDLGEIEEHLVDVRFDTMEEIKIEDKLESWSKLILDELSK